MAQEPEYDVVGSAAISTANTATDGTGSLGQVAAGVSASLGTYVDSIIIQAGVTTTEGAIRIFVEDSGGKRLFKSIRVPATTLSASQPGFRVEVPIKLNLYDNSHKLHVATYNAEQFYAVAYGDKNIRQ